tara:strand:- start:7022 stop:7549 length:528 start_codon:yes stop_codon:yes gene_type:complete
MASTETVQIKRYPNRRFYARDSKNARGTKSYVSLGQIEELICGGKTVEITDSQSGKDITRSVLTQIILERQPDKMALFPTAMLHSILQANDAASSFFREYFQNCLHYLDHLNVTPKHMPNQTQPMQWMESWFKGMMPDGKAAEPPKSSPHPTEDLARRLEEMEIRLRELEKTDEE